MANVTNITVTGLNQSGRLVTPRGSGGRVSEGRDGSESALRSLLKVRQRLAKPLVSRRIITLIRLHVRPGGDPKPYNHHSQRQAHCTKDREARERLFGWNTCIF